VVHENEHTHFSYIQQSAVSETIIAPMGSHVKHCVQVFTAALYCNDWR